MSYVPHKARTFYKSQIISKIRSVDWSLLLMVDVKGIIFELQAMHFPIFVVKRVAQKASLPLISCPHLLRKNESWNSGEAQTALWVKI